MDSKLFGSILLIVGTSIGAGMLALPIVTAHLGFFYAVLLLVGCWFVMTAGAFLVLEVNLWLPQNSNIISMAGATLGPLGQIIAWCTYLLLLYSLLCAYIAGGSDLLKSILETITISLSNWSSALLFTISFGSIVYLGIRAVDYANRVLMTMKFIAYFSIVFLVLPYVSTKLLTTTHLEDLNLTMAFMVTITSFGYANLVPSLRIYFAGDVKKLKQAIFIGSLIPLIIYIAWDAVIIGVIPYEGPNGLKAILHSPSSTSDMVHSLTQIVTKGDVVFFTKIFTSICILTSFLGITLSLTDFLSDGLQIEKKGPGKLFLLLLTLVPPFVLVLFYPHAFIVALAYAGIIAVILLIFLPACMALRGRPRREMTQKFTAWGGTPLLIFLIIFSILFVAAALIF